jgi:hypothetical protein
MNPAADRPRDWTRWRVSAGVLLGVAVAWGLCFAFPRTWDLAGIGEANRPFIDLTAFLAAGDAWRAGADPFVPNEFDPYHRPHYLTHWWFLPALLGFDRADVAWLGPLLLSAALVVAVAMVGPRNRREAAALFFLLVSPAILLGVNRANVDWFVFVLVSVALAGFRRETPLARGLGVVLAAGAAVLKYFPFVTLLLLVEFRPWRRFFSGAALFALVVVLGLPGLLKGLASAARYAPAPEWLYAFGAPVLWRDFGVTAATGWLLAGAGAGILAAILAGRACPPNPPAGRAGRAAQREYAIGAAMVAGVFFLGASYLYKLIFAVWLLPALLRGGVAVNGTSDRRLTLVLLFTLAWLEGGVAVALNLGADPGSPGAEIGLKAGLVAAQLIAWALVTCLLRDVFVHLRAEIRAFRAAVAG